MQESAFLISGLTIEVVDEIEGRSEKYHYENGLEAFCEYLNEGKEVLRINKGDRFAQGIFNKFYLVDDDCADKDRTGGFGSTGKGE